ncbi:MAG: hypothetical protein HY235_28730 [Acidobacteria bacterium]|nr:hypothetical protein [Acidobacteriota bacterium]
MAIPALYVVSPQAHAVATVAQNRYNFLVNKAEFDPAEAIPCVVAVAIGDVFGPTPFIDGVMDIDPSYNIRRGVDLGPTSLEDLRRQYGYVPDREGHIERRGNRLEAMSFQRKNRALNG